MKLGKPIQVKLGLAVRKIDFDIITGNLRLGIWMRLKWYDERLAFNATSIFGGDYNTSLDDFVPVPLRSGDERNIWVPDIMIINGTGHSHNEISEPTAMIFSAQSPKVNEDPPWNVFWSRPGIVDIHCSPPMDKFPFDKPECPILFESWGFTDRYLLLVNDTDGWQSASSFPTSNEYRFDAANGLSFNWSTCPENDWEATGKRWSSFRITLQLERFPAYPLIHTMVPTTLVMLLSSLTFFLPLAEGYTGSGERVGFAVTLLLTIIAIMLFTAEQRPAVRDTTWLDMWAYRCLFLTTLPIIETVFVVYFRGVVASQTEDELRKDVILKQFVVLDDAKQCLPTLSRMQQSLSLFWMYLLGPPLPRVIDMWCKALFPWVIFLTLIGLVPDLFQTNAQGMYAVYLMIIPMLVLNVVHCIWGLVFIVVRICRSWQESSLAQSALYHKARSFNRSTSSSSAEDEA